MESSTKVNTQQSHFTVLKILRKRQTQRSSPDKINKNLRKRVGTSKIHGLTNTRDVVVQLNLKLDSGFDFSVLRWTQEIKSV